jgi:hypothetical protein
MPGSYRMSIVILLAGREPGRAAVIGRACDLVLSVYAGGGGQYVVRIFEKVCLAAPPAGFEPAHTAPEAMCGDAASPLLTCANAMQRRVLGASLSQLYRALATGPACGRRAAGQAAVVAAPAMTACFDLVQLSPAAYTCTGGCCAGMPAPCLGPV